MALTPMDIHNKEFPRTFRGYDEDEVDKFLDSIIDEFERLYKENAEIKEHESALVDQIDQYKTMEKTLKDTLVTAQKTADDVIVNAQKKAELIVHESEIKAKQIIDEANNSVISIKKELEDNKKQFKVFKNKFKSLLNSEIEMLDQADDVDESDNG